MILFQENYLKLKNKTHIDIIKFFKITMLPMDIKLHLSNILIGKYEYIITFNSIYLFMRNNFHKLYIDNYFS